MMTSRGYRFVTALCSLAMLSGTATPSAQTQHSAPPTDAGQCRLLFSLRPGKQEPRPFRPGDVSAIAAAKADLRKRPGAVVYVPAISDGKTSFVRLEYDPTADVVSETLATSSLSEIDFRRSVWAARAGKNAYARDRLAPLVHSFDRLDDGKTVFFVDDGTFQILPSAFGRANGLVVASGSVTRAIAIAESLTTMSFPRSARVSAVFGFPESAAEYQATFGETHETARFGTLDTWRTAADAARALAGRHSIRQARQTKTELLRELEQADGVVLIVAHAAGARIVLANGRTAEITPADIAQLKFAKHPFVFLRVCNGVENGFPAAFLKAGASVVSANRGVLNVSHAMTQVSTFLDAMESGGTIHDALRKVEATFGVSAESSALYASLFSLREATID